jgi:hypothetical protein
MLRTLTLFLCLIVSLSLPCHSHTAYGAESVAIPGALSEADLRGQGYTPLINQSLNQWQVEPWHEGHWVVRDGVISYDGKGEHKRFQKNSLWTKERYGDVQLYAEWRLPAEPKLKPHPIVLFNGDFLLDEAGRRITRPRLDAGDSGILLRGVLRCQANIWSQELGSGEVNGYRTDRKVPQEVRRACIPIERADRPLGEWNSFLITLRGHRMQVELNGKAVIDATLPNLPATGPIGLQHHGDPVEFRNLWVKRLD